MNKVSLNLDTLAVTSFATTEERIEANAFSLEICTHRDSSCGVIVTL